MLRAFARTVTAELVDLAAEEQGFAPDTEQEELREKLLAAPESRALAELAACLLSTAAALDGGDGED